MPYERWCQSCDTLNTFTDETRFAPCRKCKATTFSGTPAEACGERVFGVDQSRLGVPEDSKDFGGRGD